MLVLRQSSYSGSAHNGPFRGNEGTVDPEVMDKKKEHLFTQFASRNSVSYDVAKGRDLWDQTTAEPALGIAVVQTKKINYVKDGGKSLSVSSRNHSGC